MISKFKEEFSKIKNEGEKDAICLTTIEIGTSVCSIEALSYITEKYKITGKNLKNELPKDVFDHFWKYLPMLMSSMNLLQQYAYLFIPFLPSYFDKDLLTRLLNLNGHASVLLSSYAARIDKSEITAFTREFLNKDDPPMPNQMQSVIPIIFSLDNPPYNILLDFYNPDNIFSIYALSYTLSSMNSTMMPDDDFARLSVFFLTGKIQVDTQIFEHYCFYVSRFLRINDLTKENRYIDIFSKILERKQSSIFKLLLEEIQAHKIKFPYFAMHAIFNFYNEQLFKYCAVQLLTEDNSLDDLSGLYKSFVKKKNKNVVILLEHVICALFIKTSIDNPSLRTLVKLVKEIHEIHFPLQFYAKLADLFSNDNYKNDAIEVSKCIDSDKSEIIHLFFNIFNDNSSASTLDKIKSKDDKFIDDPKSTIFILYSLCSSLSFSANSDRKSLLSEAIDHCISLIKSKGVHIKEILPSNITPNINDYEKLSNVFHSFCGVENRFAKYNKSRFIDTINKIPLKAPKR